MIRSAIQPEKRCSSATRHRRVLVADPGAGAAPGRRRLPGRARGRVTSFERVAFGITHQLEVFVAATDPVKFSRLTLTNDGPAARSISVFAYNEWVLGPPGDSDHLQVVTEPDPGRGAIFATNAYTPDIRPTWHSRAPARRRARSLPDRRAFLGRHGASRQSRRAASRRRSRAVRRGPGSLCGPARDVHPRSPAKSRTLVFLLGQGMTSPMRGMLLGRHGSRGGGPEAAREVGRSWDRTLDAVQVQTPDDSFDAPDEPLAAVPDRQLPAVGARRLLPAGRRLRLPRPAPGRHGARASRGRT